MPEFLVLVVGPTVVFSSSDGSSWAYPPPHCRQRVGAVWDNGPCVCVTEATAMQGLRGGVSFATHGARDLLSTKGGQQLRGCPVACGKSLCFQPEQPGLRGGQSGNVRGQGELLFSPQNP